MEHITQNELFNKLQERLHPQDFEVLKQVLNSYEFDLEPTHGYFSATDFNQICKQALDRFLKKLNQIETIETEDIHHHWNETLLNFQKNYWGYQKHLNRPASHRPAQKYSLPLLPPSEVPPKQPKAFTYKEAFFYIWAVLQSWILIKALILVYGNDLAKDDTIENRIIFGSIIAFSFSSLFFFAWLRRKKRK